MTSKFMKRAAMGALWAAATLAAGLAQAVGVPGQGTWETTLQPRELDGNAVNGPEAFYDTALDITWLRDANVNGEMDWNTAKTWANTLVVAGFSGWRLPKMVDTGRPGCDYDCGVNVDTASVEMAHLFHVTLGNKAYWNTSGKCCQPGWGLTNTGGFQNLQEFAYYSSGPWYSPNTGGAWGFSMSGVQGYVDQNLALYAMAVRPGDVAAAVPEPQTYALLLMGVGALMLALRRRPH